MKKYLALLIFVCLFLVSCKSHQVEADRSLTTSSTTNLQENEQEMNSYDDEYVSSTFRERVASYDPIVEEGFYFSPEQYVLRPRGIVDRVLYKSIKELEEHIKRDSDNYGVILVCEIADASKNRIMEPPEGKQEKGKIYGENHVITPIRIKKMIYQGSSVPLKEDSVIHVLEPFFYITEETPDYFKEKDKEEKRIVANEYDPLVKGKTYLLYARWAPTPIDMYDYLGQPPLTLVGEREAVYCLSDTEPKQINQPLDFYDRMWEDVKQRYGHFASSK